MSVFKVALNNPAQGFLDLDPTTAVPMTADLYGNLGTELSPSRQRTIFVAGPNRIYRELFDGATFTDCNYWKRFAFPQVPMDQAFIQVVTDDGSIWSDFLPENVYPLIFGGGTAFTVAPGDTFLTNFIDVLGTYGGFALFTQITNNGTIANQDIKVELNGSANAIMVLAHGDTQVFNAGDMSISKISFQGGVASTTLQIVMSVKTLATS